MNVRRLKVNTWLSSPVILNILWQYTCKYKKSFMCINVSLYIKKRQNGKKQQKLIYFFVCLVLTLKSSI